MQPFPSLLLACLALLPALPPLRLGSPGELRLVRDGRSPWTIVTPARPRALEREAAGRLRDFLERISGARLEIESEERVRRRGRRILIGACEAAQEEAIPSAPLGEDGFTIRAVDGDLLLLGGSAQGTDYAVSSLLERFGCRMWAPDALFVPQRRELSLPADFTDTEVPPSAWRSVHYGVAADPAYRRWHKLDWIADELGVTRSPAWVHSLLRLVPPAEYFDAHPEYYALVGGERRPTQLCLDNAGVLAITIAKIRALLAEHPGITTISVSQADNQDYCRCEAERALNEREGSPMGSMLRFVNAVAKEFPDRTISTLAYQYTRRPPLHLRPLPNVSIMLCTIEEDRSRPIAANPASTFPADLERWSELCGNIFLWDYEVQFTNLLAPFPDLRVLQPNVQWLSSHPIHSLFLQGNGRHTEMAELRCYLLAKLAWNPRIDVEATIDEFLAGYYGAAAPFLRAYLDLLHDEMEASGEPLRIFGSPADARDSWLRPQVLAAAEEHFARAREAVAGDAVAERRVRFAHLPVLFAELECARARGALPGGIWRSAEDGGREVVPGMRERLEAFLAGAEEAGQPLLREWGRTLEEYRAEWDRLLE